MAGEDSETATRHVISKESYNHQMQLVLQASEDRGLPVIFPLYDIEDHMKVSVSDVWGHFYDHISRFSGRYGADAIVISRFWQNEPEPLPLSAQPVLSGQGLLDQRPKTPLWTLQTRLYEADQLVEVKTISGELDGLLNQLVHNMADRYAAEYAVNASDLNNASRMLLSIENVGDIKHLINAEKLLLSFSAVADVMLRKLNRDVAEFEITLVGESLDLIQGLELERHFEKVFDPLALPTTAQQAEFKWVP